MRHTVAWTGSTGFSQWVVIDEHGRTTVRFAHGGGAATRSPSGPCGGPEHSGALQQGAPRANFTDVPHDCLMFAGVAGLVLFFFVNRRRPPPGRRDRTAQLRRHRPAHGMTAVAGAARRTAEWESCQLSPVLRSCALAAETPWKGVRCRCRSGPRWLTVRRLRTHPTERGRDDRATRHETSSSPVVHLRHGAPLSPAHLTGHL
jgi:hypothetical protein